MFKKIKTAIKSVFLIKKDKTVFLETVSFSKSEDTKGF